MNVLLTVIFKLYKKYRVYNLGAIIVNYFVCYLIAWIVLGRFPSSTGLIQLSWFPFAIGLGALFVIMFNLVALSTQKLGIAKTVVYQKMSLIAPVLLGILIFSELASASKFAGITAAIFAVVMLSKNDKDTITPRGIKGTKELYGIFTFFGSCIIDGMLFILGAMSIVNSADIQFIAHLFLFAGIFGIIFLLLRLYLKRRVKFGKREIIAGIALGIPNFFTIYLILKILDLGWDGSSFFPINNVGILAGAALVGVFWFREKLTNKHMIGLASALISIYLLAS